MTRDGGPRAGNHADQQPKSLDTHLETPCHGGAESRRAILDWLYPARAAVERQAQQAGQPEPAIMGFRATRTARGWSVYVQFVGLWEQGKPMGAPGSFCVVNIDGDWNVTQITGGA